MMMATVIPYCYTATYTLQSLEKNAERTYNSLWYKLPAKDQNCVCFLIQYAQRKR